MERLQRHFLICVCLLIGNQAAAHSPYYTHTEQLAPIEGEAFAIKLLHGDGIVATDPVRAIVVDGEGRLRAMSPLAVRLHIVCLTKQGQRQCFGYDSIETRVFELDPTTWDMGRVVEEGQRPLGDVYPEHMGEGFGFRTRHATWLEIVRSEGAKVIADPLIAGITVLWWTGMAMLVVPMLRRRKVTRGDVRKWSAAAIVWNVLRLFCFVGLAFLTDFWLWWEPFSLYYAGGAAVLGGLIAVFLTRPRRREAKTLAKT